MKIRRGLGDPFRYSSRERQHARVAAVLAPEKATVRARGRDFEKPLKAQAPSGESTASIQCVKFKTHVTFSE